MSSVEIPSPPSVRTTVRRKRDRGRYDRATVDAILDEALLCHVAFVRDGSPVVLPMAHVRIGDHLYLHGAAANAMLRDLATGAEACVTVTLLDGLVLARSAFHHSVNYRSVVAFGRAERVTDAAEVRAVSTALLDHVAPGRAADARPPDDAEVRATLVVRIPLDEASAKVREGGPIDDEVDLDLPVWAGVVPLATVRGAGVPDPAGRADLPVPPYA